ncbi:hypothetical protein G9F71_010465 [Clostridium sp. FP2]|uniref:hypothetical protein n=1 Tax=Clostridium sp. FP2 TaxID=2724481 RepID=UPI0013E936AD|nr:hypothetical protein [Clostridium sp. FP2]MBZ9623276.1 hypothetical protein [Clostridium sp. FP2]
MVEDIQVVQSSGKVKNGFKADELGNDKVNTNFKKIKKNLIPIYDMSVVDMENEEILVKVDENNEPISYINKNITSKKTIANKDKSLNKEELKKIAENVAESLKKSNNTSEENKTFISESNFNNGFISYEWKRTYKGYKYDFDFEVVALDPSTGDVAVASKMFVSKVPEINIKLKQEEAEKIAVESAKEFDGFIVEKIKTKDMVIINPNYRWTSKVTEKLIKDTRLAYTFTFKMVKPYEGDLIVWIDAKNGSLLGGTITK